MAPDGLYEGACNCADDVLGVGLDDCGLVGMLEVLSRREPRMARYTVHVNRIRRLTLMPPASVCVPIGVVVPVEPMGAGIALVMLGDDEVNEPLESRRLRPSASTPPMMIFKSSRKFSNRKGVRNPREPSEKDRIGGTIRWKSQEVNKTVPSPPNVRTRSNRSGFAQHVSGVQ